jgi:hypothetical protein
MISVPIFLSVISVAMMPIVQPASVNSILPMITTTPSLADMTIRANVAILTVLTVFQKMTIVTDERV